MGLPSTCGGAALAPPDTPEVPAQGNETIHLYPPFRRGKSGHEGTAYTVQGRCTEKGRQNHPRTPPPATTYTTRQSNSKSVDNPKAFRGPPWGWRPLLRLRKFSAALGAGWPEHGDLNLRIPYPKPA